MKSNHPDLKSPDHWSMHGEVPQTRKLIMGDKKYIVFKCTILRFVFGSRVLFITSFISGI